jgi:hypothetical protein
VIVIGSSRSIRRAGQREGGGDGTDDDIGLLRGDASLGCYGGRIDGVRALPPFVVVPVSGWRRKVKSSPTSCVIVNFKYRR